MRNPLTNRPGLTRDQLVTIEDLERFKHELIEALGGMMKGSAKGLTRQWLKSHEVRKLLDISAGKLLTLRINGTLPYTRVGGVIYYDIDDIKKMFEGTKSLGH